MILRNLLFIKSLLFCLFLVFQMNLNAQTDQMRPKNANFESFSRHEIKNLESWKKLNKPEFYSHPEFGVLPYNAPCSECVEILEKRTADERYFVDIKDPSRFLTQKAYGDINFLHDGKWVSINPEIQMKTPGIFESLKTFEPVGIDTKGGKTYILTSKGKISFNQWKLIGVSNEQETELSAADWTNFTAGNDGIKVYSIFPGIDAEFEVRNGAVKTNFIVRENNYPQYTALVFRDVFQAENAAQLALKSTEGSGELQATIAGENVLQIGEGIAYPKTRDKEKLIQLKYKTSGGKMDMIVPMSWITANISSGELIIDPLVSGTSTLAQAAITGSFRGACNFSGSCDYNLAVATPAGATFTDVRFTFTYRAQGSCYLQDGATRIGLNGCLSPNQAGYYWFCNGIGTGTCAANNVSVFSDLQSCLPAPSCASQNLTFTLKFYRGCWGANGCNSACIGADSPWIMVVEGRTVEFANTGTPITLSATTVCQGQSITASTSGAFGVAPFTYNWSLSPTGTPSVGTTASVSIPFAAAGPQTIYSFVTDACGTTITSSRAVTITPGPTATAGSNSPVCQGNALNLTANTVAGATYSWTGPNGFTSNLQNPSIASATPAAAGTYTLTISNGGCSSTPSTVSVVINPSPVATAGSNSPVCIGDAINLTANTIASATYSWTGPNGFTSSLQNPSIPSSTAAAAGTYSLTITDGGCASTPSTVSVIVNPAPTATAGSNSPVCAGGALNLTANTIAGATYAWTGPNGFTSSLQNPSIPAITAAGAGTYTLIITIGSCASAPSPVTVTVNPSPAATAGGNSPVCEGTAINLTANTVAGATYSWTGPNGFTSSLQNPTIPSSTAAASGTYTLTITATGCSSVPSTVSIVVNPLPVATAGSNSPVCLGNAINLTANTVAGATYSWTGPNGFTSSLQNPTIASATAATSGTYTLTITNTGCGSAPSTVSVVVNPLPVATAGSNSPVCIGSTLNLTGNTVAGATYSWTGPNGFTSSLQNPTISGTTAAAAGTYTLTVSSSGCSSAPSTVSVVINPSPTATAGSNSPVCVGSAINLTGNTVAGATYSWTGPNGFTSSVQNPTIAASTAASAGTYTLTITATGCSSVPSTVSVVVNSVPTATAGSNSPVCLGNAINLTSNTVAGATYGWTGPNGFTSSLQNPTIAASTAAMAGTYTLTVTSTGCGSAPSTVSVVVNSLPVATAGSNSPVCLGNAINLTSNTVAGATYNWTGPNGFTSSLQNPSIPGATAAAAAGTYTLTITSGTCNSTPSTVSVIVNPAPTATAGSNSPVCLGSALNLTGNTVAGATYSWTGPNGFTSSVQNPTIASSTAASAGTYTLTITSAGCGSTPSTVSVVVNPLPTATAGSNSPLCIGDALNLTAATVAGATYSWTGPDGFTSSLQNPSISATTAAAAGTYTLTITSGTCNSAPSTVSVVVNPDPTATAGSNSPVCAGSAINLTGNTVPGAIYSWTGPNGFTSSVQNPTIASSAAASAGTYTLTITTGSCVSPPSTVSVVVNAAPIATAGSNSPVCIGDTIHLTSNTVAGATYSWTGPNGFASSLPNPFISPSTAASSGTYSLTITSNNCPSVASSIAVTVNALPTATAGSNSPVCAGSTINLTSNAVAGATYSWTGPGGFTSGLQNPSIPSSTTASAGTYSLTITTGTCVSAASTVSVVVNPLPTATAGSNSPVCSGSALNLTGNTVAGATYSWTGPNGFTSSLQNPSISASTAAASGTYTLTIANTGCTSAPSTVSVVVTPLPTATAGSNSPICVGSALNLTGNALTGATYSWTGPNGFTSTLQNPTIPTATLAAAGIYSLTITSGTCVSAISTTSVVINSPTAISTTSTNVLCGGTPGNTGSATVTPATPGTYTYAWSPSGGTGATASNLGAGTYSVTVQNAAGCISTGSVTITQPAIITLAVSSTLTGCLTPSGTATVSATGGTGAYTYAWSPSGGTAATASNLAAGTYTVTVRDANNCLQTATTTVTSANAPVVSIGNTTNINCFGQSTGSATVTVNGGTPGYTYAWSPSGGSSATASNLSAGTYTVLVRDNAGCTGSQTVNITAPAQNIVTVTGTSSSCGSNDGTVSATATGGAGNHSYVWQPGNLSGAAQNNLAAGNYVVTATDGNGCTTTGAYTVVVAGSLNVVASPVSSTINEGGSVNLTASATPNIAGTIYTWTPSEGLSCSSCQNPVATPEKTVVYTVTAVAPDGCSGTATAKVIFEIICGEYFIPTIFSPNGDGKNDEFGVSGKCIKSMQLKVYNRWGELVFEGMDQQSRWDGMHKGERVNSGTFIYMVDLLFIDGRQETLKGNVSLVR